MEVIDGKGALGGRRGEQVTKRELKQIIPTLYGWAKVDSFGGDSIILQFEKIKLRKTNSRENLSVRRFSWTELILNQEETFSLGGK